MRPDVRALVVDDDISVRLLVARILREAGCQVQEAEHGLAALRRLEADDGEYSLVVTDLVMPQMTGPALIEEICRRWPEIKLIWMSGYSDADLGSAGMACPDEIVGMRKPFTPDAMLSTVRMLLAS